MRHTDFPLDFHLFLKICQLFPWQAGTVSGLKGPCLWPAFSFCPFLLSCYNPSQSFSLPWAAPTWPHEDTSLGSLPGLGELCLYSLWLWEVRTSAPLSHSFGNTPKMREDIAFSSFSHVALLFPRICQPPPSAKGNQPPGLLVGCGSTHPGGQSVLLMERIWKWEREICAVILCVSTYR